MMSIEIKCSVVATEGEREILYEEDEDRRDMPTFIDKGKRACRVEFTLQTEGAPPRELSVDDLVALKGRRCTLVVDDGD